MMLIVLVALGVCMVVLTGWVGALEGRVRDTRRVVMAMYSGRPNVLGVQTPLGAVAASTSHGAPDNGAERAGDLSVVASPDSAAAPSLGPRSPDDLVAAPPQVRGDDVRDWLQYYTHNRYRWSDAVAEFYKRAGSDPLIAPYFHDSDVDRIARHFLAAMKLITSEGLTSRAVQRMTVAHARAHTPDGRPITGAAYDRAIEILVDVLVKAKVPDYAINDLARVVNPLRAAIVAEE